MKKKIIVSLIIFVIMLAIMPKTFAAVESKPSPAANANNVLVRTNVSNSYLLCQRMTQTGESLQGATVLPHLATNKDWGAVSYLSNSIYGTNTAGGNSGKEITINGVKYYSTTGNATGVMNWGINPYTALYTQTASLIQKYITDQESSSPTSTASTYVTEIYNNRTSRYVEVIDTGDFTARNTLGMALAETSAFSSASGYNNKLYTYKATNVNYPLSARSGLFGFSIGHPDVAASGSDSFNGTFRPVIWNR